MHRSIIRATTAKRLTYQQMLFIAHVVLEKGENPRSEKIRAQARNSQRKETAFTHLTVPTILDTSVTLELMWPDPDTDNELAVCDHSDA